MRRDCWSHRHHRDRCSSLACSVSPAVWIPAREPGLLVGKVQVPRVLIMMDVFLVAESIRRREQLGEMTRMKGSHGRMRDLQLQAPPLIDQQNASRFTKPGQDMCFLALGSMPWNWFGHGNLRCRVARHKFSSSGMQVKEDPWLFPLSRGLKRKSALMHVSESCRGSMSRSMFDLAAYLLGVGFVEIQVTCGVWSLLEQHCLNQAIVLTH